MLPKPVSKGSLSCQRSRTLAARAGHQRQKNGGVVILAHLKPAMGIMHLKRFCGGIKTDLSTQKHTLFLSLNWQNTLSLKDTEVLERNTHTQHTHSTHTHTHTYTRAEHRFSYLGLAAGTRWGGQSCSARHWQPCQHSVLSGHHVHCRSGRSPHGRCPSDCSPPGPWMSMCYMGARREEREMLINCHIVLLSFVPASLWWFETRRPSFSPCPSTCPFCEFCAL